MDPVIGEFSWDQIAEALAIWTGWDEMLPECDAARLEGVLGESEARRLLPILSRLYDEFYESKARYTSGSEADLAEHSAREFRLRYPQCPESGVQALARCYAWDYR